MKWEGKFSCPVAAGTFAVKEKTMKNLLYWTPRVLVILFTAFISLFALDVFAEGYTFWETLVALFMHLIPTFLLIIALVVAWRWERVGGLLFIGLGILFLFWFGGRGGQDVVENWFATLFMPGVMFLTGILFLADQYYRSQRPTHT